MGTGPYRLDRWTPGKEVLLSRNPHYRGAAPAFERARFVVVPEARERVARVVRGEADVADHVPLGDVTALEREPGVRVHAAPSLRVLFLCLRVDRPPFSDPRVREAFDLAIDRGELIRRAYQGRTVPATQLVPPSILGFDPAMPPPRPDRARARALLSEAGYGAGLAVRLDGPRNRYVFDVEVLTEVARQLGEAGVRVTVDVRDKAEYFPLINAGRSDFHLLGWECQSGEAGQLLDAVAHSKPRSPGGGAFGSDNTTGVADAELDRLVEAADAAPTMGQRTVALQAAMARLVAIRPVIPLLVQAEAVVTSRRVAWEPSPGFPLRLEEMRRAD